MSLQRIIVRPLAASEVHTFRQIHSAAVRSAASHYPPEVIEGWAGPVNEQVSGRWAQWFLRNADNEIRLIAELDGSPAGLGVLVVQSEELRACYVRPDAARKGVGRALVREIERIAIENGLVRLRLDSSLNAEPFYLALGYRSIERCDHVFRSGFRMAAVKMEKDLS